MATVAIAPFVRVAIMTAATVYANWDTISGLFDRAVTDATHPVYGYYVQNVFEMKNSGGAFTTRERGLFGIHWINTTGGDLDVTWTTADYVAAESAIQTFWGAHAAKLTTDVRLVEHRWYPFGPGVVPPSPPVRVTTLGVPMIGSGTTLSPHQIAMTCTFRTALRRHWGRIYLPFITPPVTTGGQMTTTVVDGVATDFRTMVTSVNASQGLVPVVWDRARKVALGVTALEVDSIPDIIRRRRPRDSAYRKIFTA